ncbi:hypothetical protein ACS0TY_026472 [Phlomoides rotata]
MIFGSYSIFWYPFYRLIPISCKTILHILRLGSILLTMMTQLHKRLLFTRILQEGFISDELALAKGLKKMFNVGSEGVLDQDIKTIDDFTCSVIRRRKAEIEQNKDEKE